MANRWLSLVLGVALIQGRFSMSPIPVPDEEWEEFSRMTRDPNYRLPTTTQPLRYEVALEPYFNNPPVDVTPFTFDGSVVIYLNATEENVNEIVMHCDDILIDSLTVEYMAADGTVQQIVDPDATFLCNSRTVEVPYSFLRIPTTEYLQLGVEYIARIRFRGTLQTNMRGFYRSYYTDSSGEVRWMGTTQFQPHHARQAFPCYDEPGFKAYFDITIIRDSDFEPTISNMPLSETETRSDGKVIETFHRTMLTSTYLLAFIVSHFESIAENTDTDRPFQIFARDNARSTGNWALDLGEALLEEMEEYTQYPYYSITDNMDMKQAAIPDFSAGAMENWGLLTYREALILYDEVNSNHFYRQRVANIISHEVAHQWFGNLVTCSWWDVLWLNEAFGRFFQYFLSHRVRPEMGYEIRFITEQLQDSMLVDSLDSVRPMTDPSVIAPADVSGHFSTISYAKAASTLRMTEHLLGEETFKKGLRYYLVRRQFQVADPHHLFESFDRAAAEDGALVGYNGITVDSYYTTWSENAGHPLLTVTTDYNTGEMIVTQVRFERNVGVSSIQTLYQVPITWTRGGAPDFENTKPSSFITEQATRLDRGSTGLEWVIFNVQQTGYYRVNYDYNNWALLTRALRGEEREVIHDYNRAQIVDDLFVMARAGIHSYHRVLNILSFLEYEDEYAPWLAAIAGFNFVDRRLAHNPEERQRLHEMIAGLSAAATNRLGFSELVTDSYMDGLFRMYLSTFLCNMGHEQCIAAAISSFQNWVNGGFIPANMRPWVYCNGLRYGTASDFNYFWNRYLLEDLASEQVVMLQSGGCTSDEASLNRWLDAIIATDSPVRVQDQTTALSSAVTGNEDNTMIMFEWITNNVEQIITTLGSVSTPLNYVTSRLLYEADITRVETWITLNEAAIGASAATAGRNGIATSRANLQFSALREGELASYLDVGYVEDNIDEQTEPTLVPTPEPTTPASTNEPLPTDEPTTPDPDSANIATLSAVTLLVTLYINYAM